MPLGREGRPHDKTEGGGEQGSGMKRQVAEVKLVKTSRSRMKRQVAEVNLVKPVI